MNSIKVEMGAIISVKSIILKHPLMLDYIKDNDKEPSWDGFIYLYNSDDLKVESIVHRVPVQVKGKNDESLLRRKTITFQVEYKQLRNYYRDGGVFYIVAVISDDGEKTVIFYNALSTIKLHDLLKGTERKGPEQKKSIALRKLEKNQSENLFKLLTQLGLDREKQGAGNGEIIKKAINIYDMDNVDFVQASSFFANNECELIREIATGEVALYGHRKDIDMWFPFDYSHQREIEFKHIIQMHRMIGIDGVNYYNSYLVERNLIQGNNPIIIVSENLKIDLLQGKFYFETVGAINSLLEDVKFIKALIGGKQLLINNQKVVDIKNVKVDKAMMDKIQLIIDLSKAFKEVGIECNKRFEFFTKDNWANINELLNLCQGKIKPKVGKENAWYVWNWDEQIVPLLLQINAEGKLDIINWFVTKQYFLFVNDEMKVQVPRFMLFKREILQRLYDVPEKLWVDEIERIDYSEENLNEVVLFFVEILAAYDMTQNEVYYKVADVLIDKLLVVRPEDEYILINKMQLIKRKGDLTKDCIIKLEEIEGKTQNPMTKCAVNILLENRRAAGRLIESLSERERNELMSFPIYNLL